MLDPSSWVQRFAALLKPGGRVLDLACGSGRHSIFLANAGFDVLGVDSNVESLALARENLGQLKSGNPQWLEMDLEAAVWPLSSASFGFWDGIVVTNYLYRPFLEVLPSLLSKGGFLIYETFAQGNAEFGKPTSPKFLLNPAELLQLAQRSGLRVWAYEDLFTDLPKPAMVQRLCAQKSA
ncbi:class I SAM-dependent methyltransferase [Polynucleobacter sp. IMCC30063]|uniref:class I SAM-dependent methyltransferase n=1 Tax=unclassified Polynucleobacter TaxID=2640945 RepID=UPI001F3FC45C|nr:class I SAM-dependent methyltransferase [Polynucleobacter sp. IMCC30063]MCE7527355.1 class I SAM-dependent methyltransferase [Polynucleobacter sp. IMCC 30228]MCE7528781.1 class I SAM-dependent methyltransferase [Polynucleobacter sp. IMCC 29146]